MSTEGMSLCPWAVNIWNSTHWQLLDVLGGRVKWCSLYRSRNWGPPMIISAPVSRYKENPSFTPDEAKSCKGHREEEATGSTLREILE